MGVEFELKIKKSSKKSFQDLLFSGQIQQFESECSYYFLKSFANNENLSDQLIDLQNKFEIVIEELPLVKKEREYKAGLKKARAERKRLPSHQLIIFIDYVLKC